MLRSRSVLPLGAGTTAGLLEAEEEKVAEGRLRLREDSRVERMSDVRESQASGEDEKNEGEEEEGFRGKERA